MKGWARTNWLYHRAMAHRHRAVDALMLNGTQSNRRRYTKWVEESERRQVRASEAVTVWLGKMGW